MAGNQQVMRIRQLSSNCLRYIVGMAGAVCIGYDWPCIESLCRMSGINTHKGIIDKLRKLEELDLKYINSKEAAVNG